MQVTCKANTGKALTTKYLIGNTLESIFYVAIGKTYDVSSHVVETVTIRGKLCDR
jgi:hypothetical protein